MKSMIVIALALTSVASFAATTETSKACAKLTGKELAACEAKATKTAATTASTTTTKEVKKDVKAAKKDAAATTTTAAATTTTTATKDAPVKK